MPPLLADFIYNRVCKLKYGKFLIPPIIYRNICLHLSITGFGHIINLLHGASILHRAGGLYKVWDELGLLSSRSLFAYNKNPYHSLGAFSRTLLLHLDFCLELPQ